MIAANWMLIALLGKAAYTDLKEGIIPDATHIGLLTCFIVVKTCSISVFPAWHESVYGVMIGFGLTIYLALIKVMGLGDVKLMTVLGAWFGYRIIDVFLLSFIVGFFFAIYYFVRHKDGRYQVPFAPSIAIAAVILWLSGKSILMFR